MNRKSAMANEDLTKLKIDKSASVTAPVRRRKALYPVIAIIVIAIARCS